MVFWKVAIHCPNAQSGLPHAYILNKEEINQRPRTASIYSGNAPLSVGYARGAAHKLPGTNKPANWLCHGNFTSQSEPNWQRSNQANERIHQSCNQLA